MKVLVLGLVVFLGLHLVPTAPALRDGLRARLGAGPYKGLFSVLSVVSLVLIVIGYKSAHALTEGNPQLWEPITGHGVAIALMLPACILMAAAYVPSRIRSVARHPMLLAVGLWAGAHLLVRGDLAGALLFGGFLAYVLIDLVSATARTARGPLGAAQGAAKGDLIALGIGGAAYAVLLFWLHGAMSGMPLV